MKNVSLLLSLLIFSNFLGAQEMLYPDMRNKREGFLRVQEKDIRKDLATFTIIGIVERMNTEPLQEIPPVDYDHDYIKFEGAGYEIWLRGRNFKQDEAKLTFYDEKYLVKIDGKPFYGHYGSIPRTRLDEVIVVKNKKDTIKIPPAAWFDIYSPAFTYSEQGEVRTNCNVTLSKDKQRLYIYMLNDEKVGRYEVTWVIVNDQYYKRVVDSGIVP